MAILKVESRDLGGLSVRLAGSVLGFYAIHKATEALRRAALELGIPFRVVLSLDFAPWEYWEDTDHYTLKFRDETICWTVPRE